MTWNIEESTLIYKQAIEYLKNTLGIPDLDIYMNRPILMPYFTTIVLYLNGEIIKSGTTDIKALVQLILDKFDYGADLICTEKALDLASEIGIEVNSEFYDQDRFVFSWTNLMTYLCLILKLQYSYLFEPEYDPLCCRCSPVGQTEEDYESWTSGVYPNDEEYDRTNYVGTNSAWGTTDMRYCECYRHKSQNDGSEN